MKRITKVILWIIVPLVPIMTSFIVLKEVSYSGNYWNYLYIPWAVAISLFALALLGTTRDGIR